MKSHQRRATIIVFSLVTGLLTGCPASADESRQRESEHRFRNEHQTIVGTLTSPEKRGHDQIVLMLHGFTGTRNELPVAGTVETFYGRTAAALANAGISSFRIDFRGSGDSEGLWEDTTFRTQIADAVSTIDYLEKERILRDNQLILLGLSQGGLVATAVTAADRRVSKLILWSPVANPVATFSALLGREKIHAALRLDADAAIELTTPWGKNFALKKGFFDGLYEVDPIADIAAVTVPLLVIVGSRDDVVSPQPQMGALFTRYHPGEERLVILDANHIFNVFENSKRLDQAIDHTIRFLQPDD